MQLIDQYIDKGLSLCPIPPNTKGPRLPGWNLKENALTSSNDVPDGYGVGLCHAYSGTCALDIDSMQAASEMLRAEGVDLEGLLSASDAVKVNSGKQGRGKLIYRLPEFLGPMLTKKIVVNGETIYELRCATANGLTVQDCIYPTYHPETGKQYEWEGDWKNIPFIPAELLAHWQALIEQATPPADQTINQHVEPTDWVLAESALYVIDPDCGRDEWIKVGFALHFEGTQSGELKKAFELWDSWSAGSDKYPGEREMGSQWRSFHSDKTSAVTMGTLYEIARGYGWKRPQIDASCLFSREKQRELNRIIGDGETEEFCPLPDEITVDEMLERFVFLADGSRVFDRLHPQHIVSAGEFRQATAASVTEIPTGDFRRGDGSQKMRRIPNADVWMSSRSRLSAIGTTFKAGAGEWVVDPQGRHSVNLWTGFRRREVEGGDAGLFIDHVKWLFKDRADDFLDWLAHIEQCPGVLPHTAWLHISSKTGTGRNALSGILARVFAGYAATSLDLIHLLESGFNERLSRKVLAVVDEIREGGSDQWRHAESLKQMITSETRSINKKFGRMSEEFNACRFLLFSNHRQAIPLDDTDRRFEVVINDEKPRPAEYYKALYEAMNKPSFISAVADLLRKRDLSKFNPGKHAAKSSDKQQVIASTGSDELESLVEFTESYPLELVTANRLAFEVGINPFKQQRRFINLASDAGWQKLGRKTVGGRREVLWCRRSTFGKWQSRLSGHEAALPRVDGGNIDLQLQAIIFSSI